MHSLLVEKDPYFFIFVLLLSFYSEGMLKEVCSVLVGCIWNKRRVTYLLEGRRAEFEDPGEIMVESIILFFKEIKRKTKKFLEAPLWSCFHFFYGIIIWMIYYLRKNILERLGSSTFLMLLTSIILLSPNQSLWMPGMYILCRFSIDWILFLGMYSLTKFWNLISPICFSNLGSLLLSA